MPEDLKLAAQLFDKESYYKDRQFGSFSAIKVFSKCETLFRDIFIDRTYEEPEQDYFIYGKLVDALVTEKPEFIPKYFVRVERKVKPEDALKLENQIKELEKEIGEKENLLQSKLREKTNALGQKVDELKAKETLTPAQIKALEKAQNELTDIQQNVGEYLDKTIVKGIASRKEEVSTIKISLGMIKEYADKQQVTNSIWENAEETALALKTHPSYSNMEFNEVTSQQVFVTIIDGIPVKGKLDHLHLSPALTKIYAIYIAKQITLDQLQAKIREMNPNDLWGIITDIKTCKSVAELEPYNNHYRGQLGFYQDLVSATLLIPKNQIRCRILVADKLSSTFKKAELFEYTQEALDEIKGDVWAWVKLWWNAVQNRSYVSAKAKHGMAQKCYTCTECRFCPFSTSPGQPVMINGPRFGAKGEPAQSLSLDVSTADAVLDY